MARLPVWLTALLVVCSGPLLAAKSGSHQPAAAPQLLDTELVEVRSVDPSIAVDLYYATIYNYTGIQLYPRNLCFLHRDTALALSAVQRELLTHGYGLKIWDGYRPISLEKQMPDAPMEGRFVNHPRQGGRHARGTAVSVTLVDSKGFEVSMPTPFNFFLEKTHRDYQGLSEEVLFHRTLLEQAMERYGFVPYPRLWWHFDLKDYENYPMLDVPLEALCEEYDRLQSSISLPERE